MLSEQAIQSFRQIFKEEYGLEISDTEALELGTNLLVFFDHIYSPVKKSWFKELIDKICPKDND